MSTQRELLRPARAVWLVVEGMWMWYRRNWRSSVVSSLLNPVLFLVAIGFGLGSQIRPGALATDVSYVQYLAPAMLASVTIQVAAGESTFPVLSSFRWNRVYWAIAASPITPKQIAAGQLLWIALRLVFSGVLFVLVATVLGTIAGPGIILGLLFAVLTGMALAAPVVAFAATVESEGQAFNPLFRFVIIPMTLFAGTFFPITELPGWSQPIAWITPLWHGTELTRGVTIGGLEFWPAAGHIGYLLVLTAIGALLAGRAFEKRLAV